MHKRCKILGVTGSRTVWKKPLYSSLILALVTVTIEWLMAAGENILFYSILFPQSLLSRSPPIRKHFFLPRPRQAGIAGTAERPWLFLSSSPHLVLISYIYYMNLCAWLPCVAAWGGTDHSLPSLASWGSFDSASCFPVAFANNAKSKPLTRLSDTISLLLGINGLFVSFVSVGKAFSQQQCTAVKGGGSSLLFTSALLTAIQEFCPKCGNWNSLVRYSMGEEIP